MNCFNHMEANAVAQCVDCSKGLCKTCASAYSIPICDACNSKRKSKDITYYVKYLAIYLILFVIGYSLDFIGGKGQSNPFLSGYLLMAVVSGWQFLNKILSLHFFGTIQFFAVLGLIKLILSIIIGVIAAPITIIWNVVKLVKSITLSTDR